MTPTEFNSADQSPLGGSLVQSELGGSVNRPIGRGAIVIFVMIDESTPYSIDQNDDAQENWDNDRAAWVDMRETALLNNPNIIPFVLAQNVALDGPGDGSITPGGGVSGGGDGISISLQPRPPSVDQVIEHFDLGAQGMPVYRAHAAADGPLGIRAFVDTSGSALGAQLFLVAGQTKAALKDRGDWSGPDSRYIIEAFNHERWLPPATAAVIEILGN